jgi:hypothetical protein
VSNCIRFPLTPSFLIASASAFIGMGDERTSDDLTLTDIFLREVGLPPGSPWGTAFVSHVGHWSHFDHDGKKRNWPLPATGDPNALASFADQRKILRNDPVDGDIMLLWSAERRTFIHAGIILGLRQDQTNTDRGVRCATLEGDVSPNGEIGGRCVRTLDRVVSWRRGDRFIRWSDLDTRNTVGKATHDVEQLVAELMVRRAA